MEKEDNKVVEKINDLYNDFNIKKQFKDFRNDLGIVKKNIEPILEPDFNIDPLKKSSIAFKPFNLKIKIFENVFYIVIKTGIYIYSKDL